MRRAQQCRAVRSNSGVDNPKRRGEAPPFWSLGVQGRSRNAPAVLLGVSKGVFSFAKENAPFTRAAPSALRPLPPMAGKKKKHHNLRCDALWSGRRGSLAALPCRDTHSGRQTPHRGVFSLRSRPVRPSARWNQKIGAFAPYKRFAQQNLGGGRIHFARAS